MEHLSCSFYVREIFSEINAHLKLFLIQVEIRTSLYFYILRFFLLGLKDYGKISVVAKPETGNTGFCLYAYHKTNAAFFVQCKHMSTRAGKHAHTRRETCTHTEGNTRLNARTQEYSHMIMLYLYVVFMCSFYFHLFMNMKIYFFKVC